MSTPHPAERKARPSREEADKLSFINDITLINNQAEVFKLVYTLKAPAMERIATKKKKNEGTKSSLSAANSAPPLGYVDTIYPEEGAPPPPTKGHRPVLVTERSSSGQQGAPLLLHSSTTTASPPKQ